MDENVRSSPIKQAKLPLAELNCGNVCTIQSRLNKSQRIRDCVFVCLNILHPQG